MVSLHEPFSGAVVFSQTLKNNKPTSQNPQLTRSWNQMAEKDLLTIVLDAFNLCFTSPETAMTVAKSCGVIEIFMKFVTSALSSWVIPIVGGLIAGVAIGGVVYYLLKNPTDTVKGFVNATAAVVKGFTRQQRSEGASQLVKTIFQNEETKQDMIEKSKNDRVLRDVILEWAEELKKK